MFRYWGFLPHNPTTGALTLDLTDYLSTSEAQTQCKVLEYRPSQNVLGDLFHKPKTMSQTTINQFMEGKNHSASLGFALRPPPMHFVNGLAICNACAGVVSRSNCIFPFNTYEMLLVLESFFSNRS
jgi:hypothetical protein